MDAALGARLKYILREILLICIDAGVHFERDLVRTGGLADWKAPIAHCPLVAQGFHATPPKPNSATNTNTPDERQACSRRYASRRAEAICA